MRTQEEIKRIANEIRLNTQLEILAEDREKTIKKIREYAWKPRAQLLSPAVIGEILRSYDHRSQILKAQLGYLNCQTALDNYKRKVMERL